MLAKASRWIGERASMKIEHEAVFWGENSSLSARPSSSAERNSSFSTGDVFLLYDYKACCRHKTHGIDVTNRRLRAVMGNLFFVPNMCSAQPRGECQLQKFYCKIRKICTRWTSELLASCNITFSAKKLFTLQTNSTFEKKNPQTPPQRQRMS